MRSTAARGLAPAAALLAAILVAPSTARAAEVLPGIITPEEHASLEHEAEEQARAARAAFVERARMLGFDRAQIERALTPTMHRTGTFDVTLSDGTVIRFPWFRTGFAENEISNTERAIARGAGGEAANRETNKGGVRLHKGVFAAEVWALALKMDAKLAITGDAAAGQAFRGAKGGIGSGTVIRTGTRFATEVGQIVDPASPALDRRAVMQGFARSFTASGGRVGLGFDIQAGDVNTKAPEMRALSDAFEGAGRPSPGVSGKEVMRLPDGSIDPRGGIGFRAVSTGEGVWMSAVLAAGAENVALERATVGSQGWGEVGRAFGLAAVRDGARLIAIEELWNVDGERVAGTLVHPKGERATAAEVAAWIEQIDRARASGENLRTFEGGALLGQLRRGVGLSGLKLDIVGFNALGGALNERTVPELARSGTHQGARKIIVEGANLAESVEGARALDRLARRLVTVPGELANLGGVHVSNLEAIQNTHRVAITDEQARESLLQTMRSGWDRANALAERHGITVRAAVELLAVEEAMRRSMQRPDATRTSLEARLGIERRGPGMTDVLAESGRTERETARPANAVDASVSPAEARMVADAVRRAFPASHPMRGADRVRVSLQPQVEGGVRARIADGVVDVRLSPALAERVAAAGAGLPEAEARAFARQALVALALEAVDGATSMSLNLEQAARGSGAFGRGGPRKVELERLVERLGRGGLTMSTRTLERMAARDRTRGPRRGGLLDERNASTDSLRRIRDRGRANRRRGR